MARSEFRQVRVLEVAQREQGQVEVTLFWNGETSMATVVVWDWSSGTCVQLNPEPGQAKYAFTHPYAYAAASGVPGHDVLRAA